MNGDLIVFRRKCEGDPLYYERITGTGLVAFTSTLSRARVMGRGYESSELRSLLGMAGHEVEERPVRIAVPD